MIRIIIHEIHKKKSTQSRFALCAFGGDNRDRTGDLLNAIHCAVLLLSCGNSRRHTQHGSENALFSLIFVQIKYFS